MYVLHQYCRLRLHSEVAATVMLSVTLTKDDMSRFLVHVADVASFSTVSDCGYSGQKRLGS